MQITEKGYRIEEKVFDQEEIQEPTSQKLRHC